VTGLVSSTFLLIVASTLALFTAVGAVIPVIPRYVDGPLGGGGLAVGFTVVAAALAVGLREAPRPARDGSRARLVHPAALVPGSAFGLGTFGYAAFAAFMPLYAPSLGLAGSAPVFGLYAGITLAGRLFGARLPDKLGAPTTARAGLAAMAVGMAVLGVWHVPAGLWAGTAVFAAGNAFMFPAVLSLALDAAPDGERASVVGTVVAFFDLGQGAGALVLGPLVALAGYAGPFIAGAVAAASGLALLSAYLRRGPVLAPS
jgi:predicted MFS family arabinose efflux permease